MTTPARLLATLAVAAMAATGCSTFTDDEVAARVDGTEFAESELRAAIRDFSGDPDLVDADPDQVRQTISQWVLLQVLRGDLVARGIEVAPIPSGDDLTIEELFGDANSLIGQWRDAGANQVSVDDIAALYAQGPSLGGIVCSAHILVEDLATAELVLDRIADGDDFGELAAEYSFDPGSAANGGALPCSSTPAFEAQYIPEFVDAVIDARPGDVVGPVESQFGVHVITLRPFDTVALAELDAVLATDQVRFSLLVDAADIWVNPRFGEFDPVVGVAPVG